MVRVLMGKRIWYNFTRYFTDCEDMIGERQNNRTEYQVIREKWLQGNIDSGHRRLHWSNQRDVLLLFF